VRNRVTEPVKRTVKERRLDRTSNARRVVEHARVTARAIERSIDPTDRGAIDRAARAWEGGGLIDES